MGYKDLVRKFTVTTSKPDHHFIALYLSEDTKALDEVVVTGQRSEMKLEVDRKTFNVDQQIANAGGVASDVLENIPSVEVDNDGNVSLRGNSNVEVWINGKASGLSSDNRAEILQQLPAESIERIEVIDNPSAKFSAEAFSRHHQHRTQERAKGGLLRQRSGWRRHPWRSQHIIQYQLQQLTHRHLFQHRLPTPKK